METTTLPEIHSDFDVWNVAPVYWARVDDWAVVGTIDDRLRAYVIVLNRYPDDGPTYRTARLGVDPLNVGPDPSEAASAASLGLAHAHEAEAPSWVAATLGSILRRLADDDRRAR